MKEKDEAVTMMNEAISRKMAHPTVYNNFLLSLHRLDSEMAITYLKQKSMRHTIS